MDVFGTSELTTALMLGAGRAINLAVAEYMARAYALALGAGTQVLTLGTYLSGN